MSVTSRLRAIRGALTGREWISVATMTSTVVALHLVGWGVLAGVVAPQNLRLDSGQSFGIGLGVTAYILGLRHAFDADHIAAIDNTTRKLMTGGKRPLSVGFWFSLGHSSIVFGLCLLLAAGIRMLANQVDSDASALHSILSVIGTSVSGVFLWIIGILNLIVLVGILKGFRRLRNGDYDEAALEKQLSSRGLVNRFFGRATRVITKPWQMYLVGLLFGLGFDTATEVSLLVLAGGAAAFALPWYAILTLPILFAAGMSLLDSLDGCFMNFAYGWAFARPVRKIYYNLVITALSVTVALVIGTIELVSVVDDKAGITTGPMAIIGQVNLNNAGYLVVLVFAFVWILAVTIWKYGRIEEKWSASPRDETLQP
ncbi:HoxN/HupN/NixA family nickel/cobalt transporter [Diaminobutyricibacter sp. McL0618]|uniref:HoxN/HupN/NixA family nickel/cobalt transporter n=1 Tax=Leifsonia sp. McL0618 TaxID=3415677 RepID=UPI003CE96FD0